MQNAAYVNMVQSLFKTKDFNVAAEGAMHAAVGIAGEAGELLDAVKKVWAYGKPIDLENAIEELGDLEFYMEALRQQIGVSREQVLQANQDKLAKRYPGLRYSDSLAQRRLDKESTVGRDNFQP